MDNNSSSAERDENAAFVAINRTEQFNGQDVGIQPLSVGKIIQISGDLKTAAPALFALTDDKPAATDAESLAEFLEALASHGDAVLRVLSIATGVPVQALSESSDIAGLWRLAVAVYETNHAFFGPQISHLLGDLNLRMGGLMVRLAGDGATPSTTSLPLATA